MVDISIITPLFNEEESVDILYEKIKAAVEPLGRPFEIIFVDDGSSDNTIQKASIIASRDTRLKIVEFRKNFGQTAAMAAGIDLAAGDILVTMDGDLQNDPMDIPMMIDKLEQGYDLVVGWRHKRQDKLITRKIPSIIANKLIGYVTGVPIKDNGCSLKVYRGALVKNSPFYNEMHRFIPALLSLSGARVAEVKVKHHARQFGQSKYGLSRIYKVLLDLLTIKTILSLAQHPIRWFSKIALLHILISFVILMTVLMLDEASSASSMILSTIGVLCFSTGIFLFSLGMMCELIYFKGKFRVKDVLLLMSEKR